MPIMQANIKVKRGGAEGVVCGCAWMVFAACARSSSRVAGRILCSDKNRERERRRGELVVAGIEGLVLMIKCAQCSEVLNIALAR